MTLFTEAASGPFQFTSLIALMAGARAVYAVAADSQYGSRQEVIDGTLAVGRDWGLPVDRLHFITRTDKKAIAEADIFTNLGFVRPIDAEMIGSMKETAVVALMWEPWEFRDEDIDVDACIRREIPVMGTNEDHLGVRTFDYLGPLAHKLMFAAGLEGVGHKVLVLGSGRFGDAIETYFEGLGGTSLRIDNTSLLSQEALDADALIICEHHDREMLIGRPGKLGSFTELEKVNEALKVIHICGGVDVSDLKASGLSYEPPSIAEAGYMSVTTGWLGPRPVIDLHAAGLRVGELVARAYRAEKDAAAALRACRGHALCRELPVLSERMGAIR